MLDINYILLSSNGEILYDEVGHPDHVPRVGEVVNFTSGRRYQVTNVVWQVRQRGGSSVTVTAQGTEQAPRQPQPDHGLARG